MGITFGNTSPSPLDVLGVQGSRTGVEVVVSLLEVDAPLVDCPFFFDVIVCTLYDYQGNIQTVISTTGLITV